MVFHPPNRVRSIDVLLPMSLFSESPGLRERTMKTGYLARFLAAFRVRGVIFYPDDKENPDVRNARVLKEILDYICTAPYLKKRLYPIKPSLKYVGLVPPINLPIHPESSKPEEGTHYREALVIASGHSSTLEAGMGRPIRVNKRLAKGRRVVLKVNVNKGRMKIRVMSFSKSEVYPGYRVVIENKPLEEIVKDYELKIATSRLGERIDVVKDRVREMLNESKSICIAFGPADKELADIVENMDIFNITLNTIPYQGVRTVRTEEAVAYTLAILNMLCPE